MKLKYIGDPNDPTEPLQDKEAYGYVFEPGEAVEIDENAPAKEGQPSGAEIIRKLMANSHFAEDGKEPVRKKAGRPKRGE